MYWAYVDYRGVTLLPGALFQRVCPQRSLGAADYTRHVDWCRFRLAKTIGRAARQAIRMIGYGDSLTAQGGGNPAPDGSAGNQLVPNLDRDKLNGYYTTDQQPQVYGRMPADTQALYPKYDHGDEPARSMYTSGSTGI